jgi:hypothetical protein
LAALEDESACPLDREMAFSRPIGLEQSAYVGSAYDSPPEVYQYPVGVRTIWV